MEETSLYLVPTPIGNLKDMTYRAVEVLSSVDFILAEDTRTSKRLLDHYQIKTTLKPNHAYNEHKMVDKFVAELKNGVRMAVISDAGTPGISDPGFLLARAAIENGIKVECLPGAVAFIPALLKSSFAADKFMFEGFLPHKKGKQTKIKSLIERDFTSVFYESPHRLVKTLVTMKEFLGDQRRVSVSRELTKMFEETKTGTLEEVTAYFEEKGVKGEIVLLVEGV